MRKWAYASAPLALLLTWAGSRQRGSATGGGGPLLRRDGPVASIDVPDYVRVSPDHVALAPSAPDGATAAAINDMMCLANRHRYDRGLPALALDAQLVRYAQSRAEMLDAAKSKPNNNEVVSSKTPIDFNATYWTDVRENVLYSADGPTFAYWALEKSDSAEANIAGDKYMYFGVGRAGNYYVQTFGVPKDASADQSLFPACPSNETFAQWVFPAVASKDPHPALPAIAGTAFPFQAYAKSPAHYNPPGAGFDTGLVSDPSYYFSPPEGSVPYLESLSVIDSVAAANSKTPFEAIADSGVQGMTKDELNLVVCLINARRYASCLPPVALHSQLISAAQAHSYEMNRAHNMSHYGSSGPVAMRVKRRGFSYSRVGENVAYGVRDAYTMFAMFSKSQPHLDNMLSPDFTFVGTGRSGQYWTMALGSYLDRTATPPLASLPLCPGNKTAIAIAFPTGVPAKPKLETTACGGTKATPVVPPPYFQTHTGGDDGAGGGDSSSNDRTSRSERHSKSHSKSRHSSGSEQSRTAQPGPTAGADGTVTVTQTVAQTVYVDGDKLMASWESTCRARPTGQPVDPPGYSAVPLGGSSPSIVVKPGH
ncbi:hypothetical protein IWQ56_002321 [Coemansia nantahalensis]|nr:hypothetical protein IWQ56_002321 [Coemansia nantahalensis]